MEIFSKDGIGGFVALLYRMLQISKEGAEVFLEEVKEGFSLIPSVIFRVSFFYNRKDGCIHGI